MIDDFTVTVNKLSKCYYLYEKPQDRLKHSLFRRIGKRYGSEFWALRDISFALRKGETLGIVGQNGSGKSTLLQTIAGITQPTEGSINAKGRLTALLELGSGFNPEFTGRENVFLNGSILGIRHDEMKKRFDEIVAFAEIGPFMEQPVKNYSSGMFVRLAFAIAVCVDPDILLIDEALSVGDIRFQQKCLRKMKEFAKDGTIVMVSHDIGIIRRFSSRVMWLVDGSMMRLGDPHDVTKDYENYMFYGLLPSKSDSTERVPNTTHTIAPIDIEWNTFDHLRSFGDGKATITKGALYGEAPFEKLDILTDEMWMNLFLEIQIHHDMPSPLIGFIVVDKHGNHIFGTNSYIADNVLPCFIKGQTLYIKLRCKFPLLRNGQYTLSPAIASGSPANHTQHHWVHDAFIVTVASDHPAAMQSWIYPIKEAEFQVLNFK